MCVCVHASVRACTRYTELTCITDLGRSTDIKGQVLGPRSRTFVCACVRYTELTCILDLGCSRDIKGQVLGPRSRARARVCVCGTQS